MLDNCKDFINDSINFIGNMTQIYPGEKIFLVGEFINGIVAILLSTHYKVKFNIQGVFSISGLYKVPSHNKVL